MCYIVIYTFIQHHNDTIIKTYEGRNTQEGIKMQEGRLKKTSLTTYLPLTLLQGFERVACERMLKTEHKLHIFDPTVMTVHVVSFLFSWCWGQLHQGFPRTPSVGCGFPYHIWSLLSGSLLAIASWVSEVPLGRVWLSLPHLVSNPLGVCWKLPRGFPRSPSVGCGLPYHISSSNSPGSLLATALAPQTQLS